MASAGPAIRPVALMTMRTANAVWSLVDMLRINLFRDEEGEPRIWSHGTNDSAKENPGTFPWKGRWWLHLKHACFHIQWVFSRHERAMFQFGIGEEDTSQVNLYFGIPFLVSIYLVLEGYWLRRFVPTVRRKSYTKPGEYWDMPVSRTTGFSVFDGRIWFYLWADRMDSGNNKNWQEFNWGPKNFFLGRARYSQFGEQPFVGEVVLPEGRYAAHGVLYTAQWKRPRWPFPKQAKKADVEIDGGIPIPGKGETDYDLDDDAIFEICMSDVSTSDEALQRYAEAIMRARKKHAPADWQPEDGWPAHRRI